ncbi:MAG: outer membrane protein transport protein [Candidatus Aminicenantes bacterium]|nr:outer membrane protein transport protein [Candidatus Aminicenantes bacterium]
MAKKKTAFIGFFLTMSWCFLPASDFHLFECGGKAGTYGGAFVARADDPSAVYYNPAGIAFFEGINIKLNLLYGNLGHAVEGETVGSPVRSRSRQFRGSYYFSFQLLNGISFGMGMFAPYVFESKWPQDWEDSLRCVRSKLTSTTIRPVLAFRISDRFAFGLGPDFIFSGLEWAHTLPFSYYNYKGEFIEEDILKSFDVSGNAVSFSAGFLFHISERFHVGGKYQHKTTIKSKGLYKLSYFPSRNATSQITLPSEVLLGFMLSPHRKISLQLDFQWTGWGAIESWDIIPELEETESISLYFLPERVLLEGKDNWTVKAGVEYHLNSVISLRAGYSRHQNWQNVLNPVFPSLNRNVFSVGFGYDGPMWSPTDKRQIGFFSFDLYFQAVFSNRRATSTSAGDLYYDSDYWVLGMGIGWSNKGTFPKGTP